MNVASEGARRLASNRALGGHICRSCRSQIFQRQYAQAAAAIAEEPVTLPRVPPIVEAAGPRQVYKTRAGVVLSRPPQITRDLTPFEQAFYLYQRRLNERQALPFTKYFYFKRDTPADTDWKRKIKTRLTPARDIGIYNAYSKEGWNDELLVGAPESSPSHQVEALLKDAEPPSTDEKGQQLAHVEPVERPAPRETEADRTGDVQSLNRLLQRTLYLLVKGNDGTWAFPDGVLVGRENLHRAAERIIVQSAGLNMNTWVVGNHPIGHYGWDHSESVEDPERGIEVLGDKVFFMKARIMAGQANLSGNEFGLTDFKWLCKDELEEAVAPPYWKAIRNMLADR